MNRRFQDKSVIVTGAGSGTGRAVNRFGRLDVAFNDAGINIGVAPIADVEGTQWERIVAINLTGVFLRSRRSWWDMRSLLMVGSLPNRSTRRHGVP